MKNPFSLENRRALVTGSSQGLGFAIARGLAEAGATVVLNGRDAAKLDTAASPLRAEGLKIECCAFDVSDETSVNEALQALGPVDILFNNAGIQRRAPLVDMSFADWDGVIRMNLTSAFLVTRAVVPAMIERQSGKIINMCSVMSEVSRPTIANYAASKGGLKMLTRAMAVEWGKHNIQVNGIGPGYMLTPLNASLSANPQFDQWIRGRTPMGRWGRPEELVGAALLLASSASDFITGQIIYVDGGVLASL